MKKTIETSIIVHASPEKVWKELINFDSYPNWNPFITSLSGELKIGNQLKATIQGMKFAPEVFTVSEKNIFLGKGNSFLRVFLTENIFLS